MTLDGDLSTPWSLVSGEQGHLPSMGPWPCVLTVWTLPSQHRYQFYYLSLFLLAFHYLPVNLNFSLQALSTPTGLLLTHKGHLPLNSLLLSHVHFSTLSLISSCSEIMFFLPLFHISIITEARSPNSPDLL